MSRAEKRWREGDDRWKAMIARDEEKAKAKSKEPAKQCCFGISERFGKRCKNPAYWHSTYYGYPTGFSLCRSHGRRQDDYPHRTIKIK